MLGRSYYRYWMPNKVHGPIMAVMVGIGYWYWWSSSEAALFIFVAGNWKKVAP
jgi:hypothetical protein